MGKILLDFVFPISLVDSTPAASTGFLKQAVVIAKPKTGQEGQIGTFNTCNSMTEVAALTDNTNAQQLFNAGMSKCFVVLATDLDVANAIKSHLGEFWTIIISDDFDDEDIDTEKASLTKGSLTFTAKNSGGPGNEISIEFLDTVSSGSEAVTVTGKKISVAMEDGVSTATAIKSKIDAKAEAMALIDPVTIASGESSTAQADFAEDNLEGGSGQNYGAFDGMVGYASQDSEVAKEFGTAPRRAPFKASAENGAANMFYAFGKLLSNQANWKNLQYITMPFSDGITELGDADSLFDDRVSFVLSDDDYGNRLAFFVAGGAAIAAPYIEKNLRVDLQSRALQWIADNEPDYTMTEAALLEQRLQEDVMNRQYIEAPRKWISAGNVTVTLVEDNFVGQADVDIAEPKALWRLQGQMTTTL